MKIIKTDVLKWKWSQFLLVETIEDLMGSTCFIKTPTIFEVFTGCQCYMEAKNGDVYRGKVTSVAINRHTRNINVKFKWLCRRKKGRQETWEIYPYFLLVMDYRVFYSQDDEMRIKVKGNGEFIRFYPEDDHTSLIQCGDEFMPYHKTEGRHHKLWQAVIAILLKKP